MYATQDKIFEAFMGIAGDLTMNYDEYVLNVQRYRHTNGTKYSRMDQVKFVEDSP